MKGFSIVVGAIIFVILIFFGTYVYLLEQHQDQQYQDWLERKKGMGHPLFPICERTCLEDHNTSETSWSEYRIAEDRMIYLCECLIGNESVYNLTFDMQEYVVHEAGSVFSRNDSQT